MTAITRTLSLAQEVTIAEAARLVGNSKQSIHKRLTGLGLLRDRISRSGPNRGRIEKVVLTSDLLKVYPEATPSHEKQGQPSIDSLFSETHQEASQDATEATAEEGGLACAKAWHVLAFRKFLKERGLARKRGLMFYCLAVKNGELTLPAWVYKCKRNVSERSLERWEATMSIGGGASLEPKWRGHAAILDRDEEQRKFLLGLVMQLPHLSHVKLAEAMKSQFGEGAPERTVLGRWLNRWKAEHPREYLMAVNPDKAKNKYQVAFGSRSEDVERLNQRWETDATKADIIFQGDPRRYTLCAVVDVFSDRRRFLVAPTSKGQAHGLLFLRCIEEWGLPEQVKTDNGKDYTSLYMTRFFASLNIEQVLCHPFSGEEKPHVERGFKTFLHDLVEMIPGYTGHNVAQAQDLRAQKTFAQRLKEGKEGEAVEAGMTLESFVAFMETWCQADDHRERGDNSHLHGRTPAQLVNEWAKEYPIRRVKDIHSLEYILAEGGTKSVQKKGIQHQHRYFIAPELGAIVGETVEIRLSPLDAGRIAVFQNGTYFCMAEDPALTGTSRAEIANKARHIQKAADKAIRAVQREIKKSVKPAAVLDAILQDRLKAVDPVSTLQVPEFVETTAMAASSAARAAEALAEQARVDAQPPTLRPLNITPEQEQHVRALLSKEKPEEPFDRYLRLSKLPVRPAEDQEWMDFYETTPEGRVLRSALATQPARKAF